MWTDEKAHTRNGDSLVAFNGKKIFVKSCRKFKIYYLLRKSVVCRYTSIITHSFHNFEMEWWFVKLHSNIMSNKAESFNLI